MATDDDDKKSTFFRKSNSCLWTATGIVIIYAVWSLLLLILTASGHLLNSQSFECVNSQEDVTRLRREARLVYLGSGLSMAVCLLLLLEFWRKKGFYLTAIFTSTTCLLVVIIVSSVYSYKDEKQELQEFEKRYLALLPLKDTPSNTQNQLNENVCHEINNVHRWQAEFKCCGLQSYQDWKSPTPDTCLCDGKDNSSGCVGVGDLLVYEKPCLPTVLSLLRKRSSTLWIIMIVWMTMVGVFPGFFALLALMSALYVFYMLVVEECVEKFRYWIYKKRGGEDMVPVVFIRKNNDDETREDNVDDGDAKESGEVGGAVLDIEEGTNEQREGQEAAEDFDDDNAVSIILMSELQKLQEELDPPPVQHTVQCLCIIPCKPKDFYTIRIEEGSPLLPKNAKLVDADKPTGHCVWARGHHVFSVKHIVWPSERTPSHSLLPS
ncbi:uncharacterized protein LOC134004603 [Scomber scombrus]|uniref:uncharacterized protein LOC134004603 n=1 Tax=Scomber scombrus TaxID=13677 RepID=UPI002DD95C80|nr:uncharacterized protein LOC134004603 [Scomber scombrus]